MWVDQLAGALWSSYVPMRSMGKTHTAPFSEELDHFAQWRFECKRWPASNIENEAGECANGGAKRLK